MRTGARLRLDVQVHVAGPPHPLPAGLDLAAYRIVQEGLTNALRHSGARRTTVLLRYDAARLDIAVEDDGCGFDPATVGSDGHGLVGLRERVALYKGTLRVLPGESRGTRLVASLPLAEGQTSGPDRPPRRIRRSRDPAGDRR